MTLELILNVNIVKQKSCHEPTFMYFKAIIKPYRRNKLAVNFKAIIKPYRRNKLAVNIKTIIKLYGRNKLAINFKAIIKLYRRNKLAVREAGRHPMLHHIGHTRHFVVRTQIELHTDSYMGRG